MSQSLNKLSQRIADSLSRRFGSEQRLMNDFSKLSQASKAIEQQFEKAEKIPLPEKEKRLEALRRFRLAKELTALEWRMVFYGLADKDPLAPDVPTLLEDDENFPKVDGKISEMIEGKTLKRREWAALCSSYFAYQNDAPDLNPHWCVLRSHISRGYQVVKASLRREKSWMKTIEFYHDIFTPHAGTLIAEQMAAGEKNSLGTLEKIAQIPESSWLWKRIFTVLLAQLYEDNDEIFLNKISWLLTQATSWPRFRDDIISACLIRYHQSSYRDQPHTALKQAALDYWESPQLKSQQNKWNQYVDESVTAMVRSWLAKQDLTHFFELLRGNGDVDQARLFYWLRFANQMGFTRIVMGNDAWHDRSTDFVKFREDNKGRLSELRGGRSFDNAMIMQINDYLFVEFSGVGNAMYAYRIGKAPFNPESRVLDIKMHLKDSSRELWLRHSPRAEDYSKTRITGWMQKYDDELRRLGITWIAEQNVESTGKKQSVSTATAQRHIIDIVNPVRDKSIQHLINSMPCEVLDNRKRGGVLSVVVEKSEPATVIQLLKLGFTPTNKDPRRYWIK
ncbi:EH signature domain-containing protein [Buttiauxella sp. A2-C2_NF]|uniref:type I Zorya anti-phage system protein ZorC n=1 Tax=Buttiauxella ferragutiae TaxID=82989 RepID=UPI001E517BAE|nr:type I Zorya anti-phage system protein ZorC [Buttiauxella ferragutiae]MCE0826313.1 EH signature domain-containing protein [Buttiauxella ferragutiae]